MDPLQGQVVPSEEELKLQDQRQQRATDSRFQQVESHSPHLAFQDSNMSPALSLLPSNPGLEQNTDFSIFQQSGSEFAPLRALPDMSAVSERFQTTPHEFTSQTLDQASLSQHPLEETRSSCSLSPHSSPPAEVKTRNDTAPPPVTEESAPKVTALHNLEKVDNTYSLNKDIPAQQLIQILQKDVGMSSSSKSTSSSKTSEIQEIKSIDNLNPEPGLIREGPAGDASVSQQPPLINRTVNESRTCSSDVFNITVGSRSTKPDDSSEALRQELLDVQRRSSYDASEESTSKITPRQFATPFPSKIPKLKTSSTKDNLSNTSLPAAFSTGIQQRLREQDLWSSGNQTGIDGSYLGFLPQSQSTPGIFKAPPKSSVKSKFQQLSDIESTKESLGQTSAEACPPPPTSATNTEGNSPKEEEPACAKVQSLPSLTYMQKVDAWRANQSSGKTSLFDSLALQGFTGVSPKKKAYDAVSDNLNRILSQHVVKMNQTQNPPADVSATSSPRREEAVGSAPSEKDNMAGTQSASPFNRSQSHSSINTVVMSVKKEHATEARVDKHDAEEAEVQQQPTNEGGLLPLVISLGQFSDVTFSNSQDSSNSGQKVATSVGTSSVSLEVDNYDPYWTKKSRELNIEERISLYLQNLGIDQSPSTILTPFAPRGPIREPEFSPTELCTIKGSTPTKSIQPSEGGSPHKAEFSRSSLQSVDSSFSVPLSAEALVFGQENFRRASSSSETSAPAQFDLKLYPHPNEDAPGQQERDSRSVNLGPSMDQEEERNMESKRTNPEQNGEKSFVSSGAFSDIHKLLNQAENLVSPHRSSHDTLPSLRKEASLTSAFSSEDLKSQSSHLWTRSSSDSVLTTRERLPGEENLAPTTRQSGIISRSAGLSLVLNKSVQRAEPEGCSAAPPDRVPPPQPQVQPPPPPVTVETSVPEENDKLEDRPVQSSVSSPVPEESVSGRSSESSLTIQVAKLLQTETPATMVSSTTSVDHEEGRAREWIKQMISGQKCEPLELDQEDRRRIEEIKMELLLKFPKLGCPSTDTESSSASSYRLHIEVPPGHQVETHNSNIRVTKPLSDQPNSRSSGPSTSQQEDIREKVLEIDARGVNVSTTCRLSTSPSPSTLHDPPRTPPSGPLHLSQLTTERGGCTHVSPPTEEEPSCSSHLAARQASFIGLYKDSSTSAASLQQDNSYSWPFSEADKSKVIEPTKAEQVPAKSGHVSQVRLNLSPKPRDHAVGGSSAFFRDVGSTPRRFVPLRRSPSSPSSPDEGVGMSSPPEWQEVPQRQNTSLKQQRVTSAVHSSPKPLAVDPVTVPHLLPYKPRGSEELFYVPLTEADSSNDTTMESTHVGSDDAVPPRFSSDVLGQEDPRLDRGVSIRHREGIYSKRLTQPHRTMSEQDLRDAVSKRRPSPAPQSPKSSSPVPARAPLPADTVTSRRDQGTSPVSFLGHDPLPAPRRDRFETSRDDTPPLGSLDQLWQRFSERRREEESRGVSEREATLLERLERLSRMIQSDRSVSEAGPSSRERSGTAEEEPKRQQRWDSSRDSERFRAGGARDVSDMQSSASISTVDTARLVRTFGADKVQRNLKSSSSLRKLYSAINKQKEQEEQARTPSESSLTEESYTTAASGSSSDTYALPQHRGRSKSVVSKKKAVKLVSKGIQAGHLEIVRNGTRRNTRDVGTTFPSPGDRALRLNSSSSSLDQDLKSHRRPTSKSQKQTAKTYPHGVSWFISADNLKSGAHKENEPEQPRPSAVWFEALSKYMPWREREREPLRQRAVQEQRNEPQTVSKKPPYSPSSRVTLQESLRVGRPDFVSRSRQRLERLALQAEERRLQSLFNQERDELFFQPGRARRLLRPAGAARLRRAVPRKEMIQRSKQIYENLPEVRQKREEERRKAEYRSYRLNAQLYNKRITNQLLGRRSAWS